MSMTRVASRRAYKAFSATGSGGALTVASGEPVQVNGILLTSGAAATVFTLTDAEDNVLGKASIGIAKESTTIDVCWIADTGLKIQCDKTDAYATVFHCSPGN
jgi:hypothetical protein